MRLFAAGPAPGPPGRLYPLSPAHRPGGCELNLGQVLLRGSEVVRLPDIIASLSFKSFSPVMFEYVGVFFVI